jgi:hypothetical protein
MSNAADKMIAYALAQVGKPYGWGATGPDSFDCSGLVMMAAKSAGIPLGRTTYQQIIQGTSVAAADIQPGDLVFPDPGHVQIYLGGGEIVEAPHTGAQVRVVKQWFVTGIPTVYRRITDPASTTYEVGAATAPSGSSGIFETAGKVAGNLDNPEWWKRVGKGAIAAAIVIGGVLVWHKGLSETAQGMVNQ